MAITVAVYGPNLRTTPEQLHVHRPGCADTDKALYRGHQPWTAEVDSVQQVVHAIYDPGDFCYDADAEWESYLDDIKIFPCVPEMPYTTKTQGEATMATEPESTPRSAAAAAKAHDTSKTDENKARVDAINEGRDTVEQSIRSILAGGNPEHAIERAEQAAAKVAEATGETIRTKHLLYVEAMRLKKDGKRGPGRKVTDEELAVYIEGVKQADRGMSMAQELEVAYWVEKMALTRKRWVAVWGGEVRPTQASPATPRSGGKAAERIATLNAHKAAAKAARDAGHPIPDGQLATMDAGQAGKVERARRTRQAPPAMASAS